jgi:hypothetical protein
MVIAFVNLKSRFFNPVYLVNSTDLSGIAIYSKIIKAFYGANFLAAYQNLVFPYIGYD